LAARQFRLAINGAATMDTITSGTITPLRQRMLEDMRMRKMERRTQDAYVRAVRKFAGYLHRSPDSATVQDLRNFQLHLVDTGTSPATLNATLTGLRFFFDVTVGREEIMARIQPVKLPRNLPVVLSPLEVSRLIAAGTTRQDTDVGLVSCSGTNLPNPSRLGTVVRAVVSVVLTILPREHWLLSGTREELIAAWAGDLQTQYLYGSFLG
jgi:integrase